MRLESWRSGERLSLESNGNDHRAVFSWTVHDGQFEVHMDWTSPWLMPMQTHSRLRWRGRAYFVQIRSTFHYRTLSFQLNMPACMYFWKTGPGSEPLPESCLSIIRDMWRIDSPPEKQCFQKLMHFLAVFSLRHFIATCEGSQNINMLTKYFYLKAAE